MTLAYNLSQLANFVNSSGQLDAATGLTNTSNLGFPTGTLMLFQQTAAPTGWTKQTTHNNKALRVVSGTASSGGTTSFSDVFTNQTPIISLSSVTAAATTLSSSQIPSTGYQLLMTSGEGNTPGGIAGGIGASNAWTSGKIQVPDGGNSHTHALTGSATSSAITLNIQYVDLIIASKN